MERRIWYVSVVSRIIVCLANSRMGRASGRMDEDEIDPEEEDNREFVSIEDFHILHGKEVENYSLNVLLQEKICACTYKIFTTIDQITNTH